MAFNGFLSFGGIEIINAARTSAYVSNLMPGFPLVQRTKDYDTLALALGQEPYRSPLLDGADWVETRGGDAVIQSNPSHRFYGMYPLAIEGLTDSTMSADVVEGILDGGFINSQRDTTRSIRVRGLLVAADELALETGKTWLRNALRTNICGQHGDLCGYSDLRFFLAKPDVCIPRFPSDYDIADTQELGAIDPDSSPLIYSIPGTDPAMPLRATWVLSPTDGVKIRWGALGFETGEVLEEYGPYYLRRSNFIPNPTFAVNTASWAATDGTVTRETSSTREFGRFSQSPAIDYRVNWLPDPSFENLTLALAGWRASDGADAVVDGTAPQGSKVASLPDAVGGAYIEATALGPFDDPQESTLSFYVKYPDDLRITVYDNLGAEVFTDDITGLTNTWERVNIVLPAVARDYAIRVAGLGTSTLLLDGFLLETGAAMLTYFDGDTADDVGSDIYYSFSTTPASQSVRSEGVLASFTAETAETDAPFGPVTLSFDIRGNVVRPNVLVELLDPEDTVIGNLAITPQLQWQRVALNVPYGRRVRMRITSSTGGYDLDNVMLEAGSEINAYFDGSSTAPSDYELVWTATSNNSISRMTWLGTTEIERATNWRPFLSLDQGSLIATTLELEYKSEIPVEPQIEPVDRTYHDVDCTVGIRSIREVRTSVGVAAEVDFILTAANPHAISTQPETIDFAPGDPVLFADTVVNLISNPRGETDSTGYVAIPGTSGTAAMSNPAATSPFGTKSLRVSWTVASTAAGGGFYVDAPVVEGGTYCFGIGIIRVSLSNRLRLSVEWRTSGGTISTVLGTEFQVTNGVDYSTSIQGIVAPATATIARIQLVSVAGTGYANWPIAGSMTVVGLIAHYGATLISPFTGATADTDVYTYSWDGTADASTSRRSLTVATVDPLIDPDLPVLPSPPVPPSIPDIALTEQNDWLRYFVPVPAGDVALWADTVPTLTLSTGATAVRQVRVRFHANPFDFESTAIDPTNYCGEFLLSFLPANSVLTVSGVAEEAWASVAGGPTVPANQLLYGTDGTPMEWPELTCNIGYVMTVDIPPTEDLDAIDIALVVNRRE